MSLPVNNREKTLIKIWQALLERDDDKALFRVKETDGKILTYRSALFFKKASRLARAFIEELNLIEGDRVALLLEPGGDYLITMHAAWLAGLVVVPLGSEISQAEMLGVCNNADVKLLLFSPQSAATVASLLGQVSSVQHWLVTGGASARGSSSEVKYLEQVVLSVAQPDLAYFEEVSRQSNGSISERDALLVLTPHGNGVLLGEEQLLNGAILLSSGFAYHENDSEELQLSFCLHHSHSLAAILHNCLCPLFTDLVAFIPSVFEIEDFWSFVDGKSFVQVFLNRDHIRKIYSAGKRAVWIRPENLKIRLADDRSLGEQDVSGFEKRFEVPVYPCFFSTEAGGIVSSLPFSTSFEQKLECCGVYGGASYGVAIAGTDFKVVDSNGDEVSRGETGELAIRSIAAMVGYEATEPGLAYLDHTNFLYLGIRSLYFFDSAGRQHLVVVHQD